MPKLVVTPASVLLASGQSATFEAYSDGQLIEVEWSLSPGKGDLVHPPARPASPGPPAAAGAAPQMAVTVPGSQRSSSITYVAPEQASSQSIALVASLEGVSASAAISLTPDAISVIPAKVELRPSEEQRFHAVVAGYQGVAPTLGTTSEVTHGTASSPGEVTWILSPPIGDLSKDGVYTAPPRVSDSTTIYVVAALKETARQAVATVSLTSPAWRGRGVQLLGAYLLIVFSLVFLMVLLWPPALPSSAEARANRTDAEEILRRANKDLEDVEAKARPPKGKEDSQPATKEKTPTRPKSATTASSNAGSSPTQTASVPNAGTNQPSGSPSSDNSAGSAPSDQPSTPASSSPEIFAPNSLGRLQQAQKFASDDLIAKRRVEEEVNKPDIRTKLGYINREIDLLWLVLLAGTLGAFLHMSQSFSDYVGNRTIKGNWAWWYYLRPFIGAGLAFVFYAALRGGVIAIATGANAKASELNPFGVVSTAALVGMFSRAATMKLGDVFDTLFKSDKLGASKDKLVEKTDGSQPVAGTSTTSTPATASTTTTASKDTKK